MNVLYKPPCQSMVIGLLSLLLSACTGVRPMGDSSNAAGVQAARATETPIVQPTPSPTRHAPAGATPAEIRQGENGFGGKVDVGGYRLFFTCIGTGSPTVIFDNGLEAPGSFADIQLKVMEFTSACTYDRANTGLSDQAPTPRTSQDMVDDLHQLLVNANIAGPYILVGWSVAGLNLRLYASQHPADLVGMVLIDPETADQTARFLALLPPEAPGEALGLKGWRTWLTTGVQDPSQNTEGMDYPASQAQVRATGSLGHLPLVVISAARSGDGLPEELAEKMQQARIEMHKELVALSANGAHILAERSDHCVQCSQPDLVVEAILKLVEQARTQSQ
jgi:pimeloyl-ACP methyl ester carboxylesterase